MRPAPKAEQLARARIDRIPAAEAAALRAMTPDERGALIRLTGRFRALLEQQLKKRELPPEQAAQK